MEDLSFIPDLLSGPLDVYRNTASFNWKRLKLSLEGDIELLKLKVRVIFSIRFKVYELFYYYIIYLHIFVLFMLFLSLTVIYLSLCFLFKKTTREIKLVLNLFNSI